MFYVFCTLLRRDLPLPELLYTIYKLLLVVRFYFSLQVELEFTPQGFHGLKVRTLQREYATSWFFPRRREFALSYSCASGHYPVWTGARNFNNNNKRNKRRLWNIAKEIGTHDAIKYANLGGTLSTDSPHTWTMEGRSSTRRWKSCCGKCCHSLRCVELAPDAWLFRCHESAGNKQSAA